MTKIVVHHDAGSRYDTFAERLEAAAEQAAPLVEAVTGLALPDTVVLRTMTPRGWQAAHRRRDRHLLRAEARELRPSRSNRHAAKEKVKEKRKSRRLIWPMVGGQTVEFRRGGPELAIMPKAMWEAGWLNDDPVLLRHAAHEMTHLAQYAADDGAMWRLMGTLYPEQRGIADRDFGFLVEGHAYWTDKQITTKVFGAPVSTKGGSPHASLRFKALKKSLKFDVSVDDLIRATDSVGDIITAHGLDAFNQVWHRPELVPTYEEAKTPAGWIQRFE
ncbi:zinc-dependent metalloprotease [Streptomyces sp. H51]|uniref:zinc-dependent metalloprotease n=1 Tax=Streptomyces sp. H51 TaxID=3111770 RepID=UPI002D79F317|nr:zinc-dependent metalloprotease [Streptomyces sp. H51]